MGAFDPSTAQPVAFGFDPTSAQPVPAAFDPSTAQAIDFSDVEAGHTSTADNSYGIGRLLSRAGRTAASRAIDLGATLYGATPSGMAESVAGRITGAPTATDDAHQVARDIAPAPAARDDYAGRAADFVGGVVPDLAAATASGGASLGESVLARVGSGAVSMALPAAENARQRYEGGVAAGQDRIDALAGAAVTAAGTLATGALPASVGASLPTRLATGAAIGAGTSEVQRRAENAVSPENLRRGFDPFDTAAGAVMGGAMGGMHGDAPRSDGHHDVLAGAPSRPDFAPERAEQQPTPAAFDPTTARPMEEAAPTAATAPVDAMSAARSALDAQLDNVFDFDAARPIAQRVADQHGVAVDDLLPTPDWLREPAQDDASAPLQSTATDAVPSGFDASTATAVQPDRAAAPTPEPISPQRATDVRDAISNLERLGLDTDALAMIRNRLTDEPNAQDARVAESLVSTNTGVDPARAGTEAAAQDSHAQRTPIAGASVGGHINEPLDALIDRAQAAGATLGEITAAARSSDETIAAQSLRELIANKSGDASVVPRELADVHDDNTRNTAIARLRDDHAVPVRESDRAEALSLIAATQRESGVQSRFDTEGDFHGTDTGTAASDRESDALGNGGRETVAADAFDGSGSPVRHDGFLAEGSDAARGERGTTELGRAVDEFGRADQAGLAPVEQRLPARIKAAARAWKEQGTDSLFFRRFFGDSKVTDADGAPRVVHHGTGAEFTVFGADRLGDATEHATSALGHFFATDRGAADRYAANASDGRPADARVVDAYLSIRKPYRMTIDEAQDIDSAEQARAVRAKLERQGYDGIELRDAGSWIAFRPEQIKSVENRGTFDPAKSDIRFARGSRDDSAPTLDDEQVHGVARRVAGVNAMHRIAVTRWDALPAEIRKAAHEQGAAAEDVRAVHWRGKTHLVSERFRSEDDVAEAVFHEHFAHFGLRAKFGNALAPKLAELLDKVGGTDGVRKLARDQGIDLTDYETGVLGNAKIAQRDQRLILMEELLAHMSHATGTLRRTLQEWAGVVRDWLRRSGFAVLSHYDATDLAYVLRQARRAAIDAGEAGSTSRPMFQRSARDVEVPTAGRRDLDQQQVAALDKIGAQPDSLRAKVDRLTSRWREKATQGLVDQFDPIKHLDPVAYMQARMSRGVDGAVEASFLHGPVKLTDGALDVEHDGKGLRGVLADLAGEHDQFLAWVAGNRAERLASEGRERLFTDTDITALKRLNHGTMADGRNRFAAYARANEALNRYQKSVLDVAEQSGLINTDARKKWAQEYYVPFRRTDIGESGSLDPADLVPPRAKKGTPEPVEQLKGGAQPLGDLLTNVLENWNRLLVSSMRNLAATKALAAAEKLGEARKLEEATKDSLRVRIDGEPVHYAVDDPLLVDAMTMLNFNGYQSAALRVASTFKRMLSFGVTLSPSFRVRNLLRDTATALSISDHTGRNPLRNLLDGWAATKEGSATDIKLLAGGGKVRFGALTDGGRAVAAKRLIRSGVDESQILDTPAKVRKTLGEAWHWYHELGDRGESVNRAVIYDRARAAGKSHLEASYEARDLLDFTMAGKWAGVRVLTQTIPFLNARIQGLYRLGRGAKANPQRFSAVTGAVALASVALYLAQRDDEDYKALPDYARDSYWCVRLGDKMLYLPKPFEIGAIGTVAERSVELAAAGDDYRARDFAKSLYLIAVDQLAMNPLPQAVRPALESAYNYDAFRGRPIDSEGQERLPPAQRYTSRTSAAAVELGRATNTSPNQIEHLVGGYLGWLGTQALSVADAMVRPFTDLPPNPNRDATKIRNWPLVGDFVKEADGAPSKYVDRLYSAQQQLEQQYAGMRNAARSGDDAEAEAMGQGLDKLGTYRGGAKALASIRAEIRQVENDKVLTPAQKRARLDELNVQRNRVAREVDSEARVRL